MQNDDSSGIDRRRLLQGIAVVGASLALPLATAPPALALPGFPVFSGAREVIRREDLRYNPTDELIFPCIRLVEGRTATPPLGRYYLYYSPHDAPGGICLAYADSLTGPWTEYPGNPLISRTWRPHYENLSHVASPHVLWNESNRTFYMYFHGENTTTRLARSKDGLDWTYDGVVLTTGTRGVPSNITETSYARVFRHTIPSKNNTYIMMFMGALGSPPTERSIFLAWSNDQRTWSVQSRPLVSPEPDGAPNIGNPHLVLKDGVPHVVYNASTGPMYVTRVGREFDQETHLGVFHRPLAGPPDNGRSAAPSFAQSGGVVHMFYESGTRLDARIVLATAPAVDGVVFPT